MAAAAAGILTASVALVTPIVLLFFFQRSEFSLFLSSFLDAQELGLCSVACGDTPYTSGRTDNQTTMWSLVTDISGLRRAPHIFK